MNNIEQRITNEAPNATPAFLLCLFLGMLGAHRFYLGRKGSAIAQLLLTLTLVGAFISVPWAIIDLFLIGGICKEERAKLRQQYQIEQMASRGGES